jgi:hypothetical protein
MNASNPGASKIRNPNIEIQNKHEHKNPNALSIQKLRRIPFKQFCDLDLFSGSDIRAYFLLLHSSFSVAIGKSYRD